MAWSFDYGQDFTEETERVLLDAVAQPYISGLTLLGGEPMEPSNQRALVPFLKRFRARFAQTKTIWVYTGCVYDMDLLPHTKPSRWRTEVTDEFLGMVDILVDGPYIEDLKDISLRFRGSSNQRILNLRELNRPA